MTRLLLLAFLVFSTALGFAQSAAQISSEGQRAYLSGDIESAKAKFKMTLELDPGNVAARNYLRIITTQEAKAGGGAQLEKQLRSLILPTVKFQEATFSAALESLKQQAAKQSVEMSFVTQLPPEAMERQVTLNLANVPFTVALRYLCELNGARFSVEKFAVVIKRAGAAEPARSPSAQ